MVTWLHGYMVTYAFLLDEVDELGALALDRVALLVVESHNKVEEVAFAQVARRLLFKVCTANLATASIKAYTSTALSNQHLARQEDTKSQGAEFLVVVQT